MPRSLKVSPPLIANMILFVNMSNFLCEKLLTQWLSTYHIIDSFAFYLWVEDIIEYNNGKCHVFTL